MNDKLHKFERLAEKRVTETVKKMRLIGNLANRNNYYYTDEHVKEIISALENELRFLKDRFKDEKHLEPFQFTFQAKNASKEKN